MSILRQAFSNFEISFLLYKSRSPDSQNICCCSISFGGMKLIVILAIISFASTHPVNRTGLVGNHHHFTEDEHVLFHLSKMVLDLKNSDILESITKIPIPQLTNCITADQRKLIKNCATRAKQSLKTGTPMKEVDGNESMQDKTSEELEHENSHSAFPMTIRCIIESFIPTGIAGEVDLTHLKIGIINTTSLSMSQKNSAGIDFESCMSSNVTIILHPHRNSSTTDQLDGANKKSFKEMKTMLCISKAIILNGCADVSITVAKLEMAPELLQSSENPSEAKTHGKAEMLAQPYPHLSSVPHDHDFLDVVTEIVMKIKFKGDTDKINSFEPSKLLSCVPQEQREAIHKRCEENLIDGDHHHMIMANMKVAECILVDLVKALNNETGIVDVKVVETGIINNVNSLSADQKQLATASVESCIESNYTHSSHYEEMAVEEEMSNLLGKYGKRNDPMRTMVCVVKALIENGCSSTRVEKRAVKLTASYYTDSSSGENSNEDISDES